MNPVILFEHVSKRFAMQTERTRSFQDALLNTLHRRNRRREAFWALTDVSLAVNKGEMVGLIGPNGAGKSTILKLMTRILEPTSGAISVKGRVAALLELGTGFHPDLTGRENVFLNGSLIGLSRRYIEDRMESIIDFAGMERFIDVPVRHYSSGMYMRLGFSVAVHSDPAILITDEVLAVGDEAFQNKCLERMSQFRDDGVTIILVSHALPIVRKLCTRVMWLRQGSIVMDGDTNTVIDSYMADVASGQEAEHAGAAIARQPQHAPAVAGLADLRLLGVDLIGPDGRPGWRRKAGERSTMRVHYQARFDFPQAAVAVHIHDADDQSLICSYNSALEQTPVELRAGKGHVDLSDVLLPLRAGHYTLTVAIYRQPDAPAWANPDDVHHKAYALHIDSPYTSPHKRWGSGQAVVSCVRLCGADGREKADFATGEPLRLFLRCVNTGQPVKNPMLRVLITDSQGMVCHATNSARTGVALGELDTARDVCLTYERLLLLEGDYALSVGALPADTVARRPYDWHDGAYRFHVHSTERDGAGLVNLSHQWTLL